MAARAVTLLALPGSAGAALAFAGSIALLAAALPGCSDDPVSHVYSGRMLEAARACLDPVTSIDVVDGPAPASPCAPACFVAPYPDDSGVNAVYVSTMCAPFPPAYDATGTNAACGAALAAYARNDTCEDDGGTSHPADAGDGADVRAE